VLSPEQRSIRARIAAYALHGQGKTSTEAGRAAFLSRFEIEADPDGTLSPAERSRRAAHLRKAHFYRLRLARSKKQARNTNREPVQ
jgi:hypothetical protein